MKQYISALSASWDLAEEVLFLDLQNSVITFWQGCYISMDYAM